MRLTRIMARVRRARVPGGPSALQGMRNLYYRSEVLQRLYRYPPVRDLFRRLVVRHLYPNNVTIELSNKCNALCIFCSYPTVRATSSKPFQHMSEATFAAAEAFIDRQQPPYVSFTPVTGEIFLHPEWHHYVQRVLLNPRVAEVGFYTNAILLHQQNIDRLLALDRLDKLTVHLSVAGYDRASYHTMFGVDRFDEVRTHIAQLTRSLEQSSIRIPLGLELRLATGMHVTLAQAQEIYNPSGYRPFGINIRTAFDPVSGLVAAPTLRYQTPRDKDRAPCRLVRDIRFAANGDVWACSCISSELPDDSSLRIGAADDPQEVLLQRREQLIRAWRDDNHIPEPCRPCTIYMPEL